MKIVHLAGQLSYGGTEKTACLLARYAQMQGHSASVYARRGGERESWARELLGDGNVRIGVDAIESEIPEDTDIIHGHVGEATKPHRVGKAKYVEHSVFGDISPGCDLSIFVSSELAAIRAPLIRERGLDFTKFAILHNPVRPQHVTGKLDGLPEETLILGSMGRPDSNIFEPTHLKAVAVFMARFPDRKVLYVRMGASPAEEESLKTLAIPHRIVEPTCSDGAISRFLNSLDVYLHSRRDGESDGMCIAEALAHGIRVIAHCGGTFKAHVAQLAEFTEFTRLVATHDEVAYADAITEFGADEMTKRVAAQVLPQQVLARRGIDVIGGRCLGLYERVMA